MVKSTHRPLYPRERDPVPIVLEAGWAQGPKRCSSTLSLTSALDGVDGQRHAPAALSPVKTRYPLYRRLCGPQCRSGRVRKIPDRPARSESLYRLSYPGLLVAECSAKLNDCKILPSRISRIRRGACYCVPTAADRTVVTLTIPVNSDAVRFPEIASS